MIPYTQATFLRTDSHDPATDGPFFNVRRRAMRVSRLLAFRELWMAFLWWRRGKHPAVRNSLFAARTIAIKGRYPTTAEYKKFCGND